MSKVWIDAGHGGSDPGALNGNYKEKTFNLNVSLKVKSHLERHGVQVLMTRTGDTSHSLSERSSGANNNYVNAFVSIHCNSYSNKSAQGLETFSYFNSPNGDRLSKCIYDNVVSAKLYTKLRGTKNQNLHVVRETNMAAALIEMAFISNEEDLNLLINKQEEFSIAITKGILQYLGIAYKNPTPPPTNDNNNNNNNGKTLFYRVICGSYTNKNNAINKQNELKSKSENSFLDAFYKDNVLYYRVICGSYTNKQNALNKQNELKAKGQDSFLYAFYK